MGNKNLAHFYKLSSPSQEYAVDSKVGTVYQLTGNFFTTSVGAKVKVSLFLGGLDTIYNLDISLTPTEKLKVKREGRVLKISFTPCETSSYTLSVKNRETGNNIQNSPMTIIVTPNYKLLRKVKKVSSHKTCIQYPCSVALDDNGSYWVVDGYNNSVKILDCAMNLTKEIKDNGKNIMTGPSEITRDSCGNYLVSDILSGNLIVLDKNGKYLTHKGFPEGQCPNGMYHDPRTKKTYLTLSSSSMIQVLDENLNTLLTFGEEGKEDGMMSFPTGICVNSRGEIVVSDGRNGRIQVFDQEGHFLRSFGKECLSSDQCYISGLTTDADDNVIVCNTPHHELKIFSRHGYLLYSINLFPIMPSFVHIKRDGSFIISDIKNHRILEIST